MEVYLELIVAKIKELPKYERPREKALRYGIASLSNEELIAILLRTGTKEKSALDLAHKLNSESRGLANLFHMPFQALIDINGIGPGKALILSSCFELCSRYIKSLSGEMGPVDLKSLISRYSLRLKNEDSEMLILISLNQRKEIIYEECLYKGSDISVDCQPEQIVKKVLLHNGKSFYLIHNHPSGNYEPSSSDAYVTTEIVRYSRKMNIKLEDHIIIGKNGYYSFKNMTLSPLIIN